MEPRLHALLRRRGAPTPVAEDIAQEVALRAWRHAIDFDSPDQLFWWCSTVGRRLLIDHHRREQRVTPVQELPEVRMLPDPADEIETRELLSTVLREFRRLPASQRESLFSSGSRAAKSTSYVRRHRARARLLAVVEGFGVLWAWLHRRLQIAPTNHPELIGLAAVTLPPLVAIAMALSPQEQPTMLEPGAPQPGQAANDVLSDPPTTTTSTPTTEEAAPPAPAPTARPHEDRPRSFTIDPPAEPGVAKPMPVRGRVVAVVEHEEPSPPLLCARLGTVGREDCINYPTAGLP